MLFVQSANVMIRVICASNEHADDVFGAEKEDVNKKRILRFPRDHILLHSAKDILLLNKHNKVIGISNFSECEDNAIIDD